MSQQKRLPAEWEPQSAIMLTWPHEDSDWCDILEEVEQVYFELLNHILRFEHALVVVPDLTTQQRIEAQYADTEFTLSFCIAASDDTWARDHGPIVIESNGQLQILNFMFNAWGDKFPWQKDNAINLAIEQSGLFGKNNFQSIDFVLEGGSIDSDGAGTLLTTSKCLLSTSRNGALSRDQISHRLTEELGSPRILWLDNGYLAGDDTDSHIDTLARFCDASTICYVQCQDQSDEHYDALTAMESELKNFKQSDGEPYKLVPLPLPEAIYCDGERLPATYANFLIINDAVLAPVYLVASDGPALKSLAGCFPGRQIIPVDCRALIKQHGSLHCITMQLPSGVMA